MIIDIPRQIPFRQENDGELKGSLSRTFNVDLEEERGKIVLSRRMNLNTGTGDEANLTTPTSWAYYDNRYFCIAGGTIYKNNTDSRGSITNGFIPDTDSLTPTSLDGDEDLIVFNNKLYFVGDTIFEKSTQDTSDWVSVSTSPSAGFHSTTVFGNRLYYSNLDDHVNSMDSAESVSTSGAYTLNLELGSSFEISSIRASDTGIWIGTINESGGRARMYFWDGVTADTVENKYDIPDVSVKSIVIHKNRPYIVTGRGLIMTFNGSYFEEVARFPFYHLIKTEFNDAERKSSWIYDNSIAIVDNKIHISIGNRPLDNTDFPTVNDSNNSYAGVWVLDDEFGLYHKYAFFSENDDSDNVNTQIDTYEGGAIYPAKYPVNLNEWEQAGKFLVGGAVYSDATTRDYGIFTVPSQYGELSTTRQFRNSLGWFVTTQIQSSQLLESWQKLFLTVKPMENSTDKVVVKYRIDEEDYQDSDITWTSTTTFTSTDTLWSTIEDEYNSDVDTDYEVTILRGKGGGMCSHITNVSSGGAGYTISVDETHTGATSGTAKARIEKWKKLGTITDSSEIQQFNDFAVNEDSTFIQFKVFMIGKGKNPVVERIVSASEIKSFYQ